MRWKYAAAASAVVALIALGAAQARVSRADPRREDEDVAGALAAHRAQPPEPGPIFVALAQEPASEPKADPSPESLLPPPAPDALIPPPASGDVPGLPPGQEPPSRLEPLPSDAAAPLLSPPRPEPVATPLLDRVSRPIDPRSEPTVPPPFDLDSRPMDDERSPFGGPEASRPTSDEEQAIRALARQLAESDPGAEGRTIRPEGVRQEWSNLLRGRLASQFVERQRRYAAEVDALEARVAKLRELIRKREENSERIIDDRIKQLMAEAQGMGW